MLSRRSRLAEFRSQSRSFLDRLASRDGPLRSIETSKGPEPGAHRHPPCVVLPSVPLNLFQASVRTITPSSRNANAKTTKMAPKRPLAGKGTLRRRFRHQGPPMTPPFTPLDRKIARFPRSSRSFSAIPGAARPGMSWVSGPDLRTSLYCETGPSGQSSRVAG